ncbi:hypothetical protein MTP99_005290 [Tenebrio molitor]|nr:hypothetical protein MTP99_005290 [Tenebrio molitor]
MCDINEDSDTLTPSLRFSGRGINLALAPQTPNFYPICVGSSKSLRHLRISTAKDGIMRKQKPSAGVAEQLCVQDHTS